MWVAMDFPRQMHRSPQRLTRCCYAARSFGGGGLESGSASISRTSVAVHGRRGDWWKLCLELGCVAITLLVDISTSGYKIVTAFVPPHFHSVFQGKKRRDRVTTNDRDSHQPGKEVPRGDMVCETFFSREMLRRVEVEVGLIRLFRILLVVIWRACESRYQGLLHQGPTARVQEKFVRNAE